MDAVEVRRGGSPLILSFPHVGTGVPPEIGARLNENGKLLADTDWHVDHLYEGLVEDATWVRANFHRYVIDANRDPAGTSLYPGQNTTGLVPETDFDGEPIWRPGAEPTQADIAERLAAFHAPYHAALAAEIARVKALHGLAVLYDAHSIRSKIPFLFEGTLPDLNLGTNDGHACTPAIQAAALAAVRQAEGFSSVLNGRFKGGWTTRHYGRPETGVHAVQMELAQSAYVACEHPPFTYDDAKAGRLRKILREVLSRIEAIALELSSRGND
jgi:formiminoglutamase